MRPRPHRAASRNGGRKRRSEKGGKPTRRKPYVFRFKSPDRSFSLSLAFRQSEVDKHDLIQALEQILADLRQDNEK